MRKTRSVPDLPANPETTATVTWIVLIAAALILFAMPRYMTLGFNDGPSVQLGEWDATERASEPWQVGDWGQLRHLRYADNSTCTQALTGPFAIQLCR